jgi:hypothetical protein
MIPSSSARRSTNRTFPLVDRYPFRNQVAVNYRKRVRDHTDGNTCTCNSAIEAPLRRITRKERDDYGRDHAMQRMRLLPRRPRAGHLPGVWGTEKHVCGVLGSGRPRRYQDARQPQICLRRRVPGQPHVHALSSDSRGRGCTSVCSGCVRQGGTRGNSPRARPPRIHGRLRHYSRQPQDRG